ncbi:hypothetical protein [Lacunimicrobium album]
MIRTIFSAIAFLAFAPLTAADLPSKPIDFDTSEQALQISQTIEGLGAAQGITRHDGLLYIYGDAETGVIREYRYEPASPEPLQWTGLEIKLTRNGIDVAPHPTGLTFGSHGVFLGDTVYRRGTIFRIDWEQAKKDGHLDHAILNQINDDLGLNGTRPEYVTIQGKELIATSDYGPTGNEIRLYDPEKLKSVVRTSSPGVLVTKQPTGPWVQTLCWNEQTKELILVQNQIEGLGYQLSTTPLDSAGTCATPLNTLKLSYPTDELEGFEILPDGRAIFLNSSRQKNAWFATMNLETITR